MIKLFIIGGLLYAAYRIYVPKSIEGSKTDVLNELEDDEFTDYEEID